MKDIYCQSSESWEVQDQGNGLSTMVSGEYLVPPGLQTTTFFTVSLHRGVDKASFLVSLLI